MSKTDNRVLGIGGAPTRATTLPEGAEERKKFPVASGVLDYFPDALVAISNISQRGNDQHNPGKPLNWNRSKSADESDTMIRHFLQRGTLDTDGTRHTAKLAWRALALLQKEIEAEQVPLTADMQKAGLALAKWAAEKEIFLETCKAKSVEIANETACEIDRRFRDDAINGYRIAPGCTNPCGCAPAFEGVLGQPLGRCESSGGDYPHHKDFLIEKFGSQAACINWKPEEK